MTDVSIKSLTAKVEAVLERLPESGDWKTAVRDIIRKEFNLEADKDFKFSDVLESLDQLKAQQETLQKAIQFSRRGAYVPGLEDQFKKFNLLKAVISVKTKNPDFAPHEREIMKTCYDRMVSLGVIAGDDASAGAFIPDQVIPDVIEPYYTRSAFIALDGENGETRVSVIDGLQGQHIKLPQFDGGMVAYWIGEEDDYVESEIGGKDKSATPKKLGVLARLTEEQMRWSGYGLDRLFRRDMVKALVKKTDYAIAYGTGSSNMPQGICNTPDIRVYAAAAAGAGTRYDSIAAANTAVTEWGGINPHWDHIEDIDLNFEEDDVYLNDISTISSPRFFKYLKQLKVENYSSQTSGNPYLLGSPMITDSAVAELLGAFGKSNQIGSNVNPGSSIGGTDAGAEGKCTDVFRGDFSEVLFLRWGGMDLSDDAGMGKGFTSDHTYVKGRMFCDVMVRQPRAITVCPNFKVRA